MHRLAAVLSAALIALGIGIGPAAPARADCSGTNMFEELQPSEQAALRSSAEAQPFAQGNFWRASRGDESLTLIGTYHFDDPRHDPTLAALRPLIAEAPALLVEAGPEEEAALMQALSDNPGLIFINDGPSLLDRLPPDTWKRLSEALEARGIPGVMAARFQPWYATVVLALAPCALESGQTPRGLDGMLIEAAGALSVPVRALEPYDTLFAIFEGFDERQEIDMIESSLAMEGRSEDFAATLADLYFAGESRLIWELMRELSYGQPGYSREEVDAEMAVMEEAMMTRRNLAWIPVIEAAAAEGPPVVAFGALHLSGEAGVLNLLAERGWTLEPLPF
ncbi:TraB/GumN family protein [Pseudogemmobacter sonorensis]|uniref:TraB/GumN family protein n=1 Tax=Pseudogemmobacter sonorensis TaxID=2989681 RepID=UPI003680D436